MNNLLNYIFFKDEVTKFETMKNNINENTTLSNIIKQYDKLYKQLRKVKSLQQGKFTTYNVSEEFFLNEYRERLKNCYFGKMDAIFSEYDAISCASFIRGYIDDLNSYNSIYFSGIIKSILKDMSTVLENINTIFFNYSKIKQKKLKMKKN